MTTVNNGTGPPVRTLGLLLALFVLLPLGCLSGPEEGEDTITAQETPTETPAHFSVEGPSSTPGDPLVLTGPGSSASASDSLGIVSPSDANLEDSAGRPSDAVQAQIMEQLDRLERENDSLRAAVGALLGFWAGEPPGSGLREGGATEASPQSQPAGGSGEILAVDAQQVQHWGLRIAVSIAFLLLSGLVIRIVVWVLDKLAERNPKRRLLFKRLVPIARIALWFLAILIVGAVILRVEAQGLIAAGAAVGVAVGFAAQDILKNVFGGLIVLFDQPFQVGDKVSVGGTYGEVVSIGLRSTRIVTSDDNLVSVPNAQIVDGQVANANAGELNCQVVTDLFLPGWVDEAKAKEIAFDAAAGSKYVFLNKPIVVLVKDEFRETFITHLKVKAYVLDPRYEFLFMSDVTERARAEFRRAGLLSPRHGARAYLDLDGFPPGSPSSRGEGGGE